MYKSSFVLALFAAIASAAESYQRYPSYTPTVYRRPNSNTSPRYSKYYGHETGHSNRGYHGTNYTGAYKPIPNGHGGQGHQHRYPDTIDPAKAGWYSPY